MFIILETQWLEYVNVAIDPDTGRTLLFNSWEEAKKYADDNVQKPLIVEIPR